eukprot:Rhum_TRINITY_DN14305_c9_g2::Rhum_TRINITY_DN14305_c9_g2_i1::g.80212::m.80212
MRVLPPPPLPPATVSSLSSSSLFSFASCSSIPFLKELSSCPPPHPPSPIPPRPSPPLNAALTPPDSTMSAVSGKYGLDMKGSYRNGSEVRSQNASSRSSQYSPGARRAPATPRSPQPRFPPRDPVEAHLYDCYHPSPHGGRRAQSPAASCAAVPSSPVIVERQLSQGLRDYRVRRGSQKGGCVAYELRHMQDAEWAASQHLQDQRVRVLEAPAKKSRRFDVHDTHVFSQTKSVTAKKRDKHNAAPSPRESGFFAGGRIQYDDSTYYHSETSLPASPLSRSSGTTTTRARSPGASRRPSSPAPRRRTPATPVTHSPFARSGGGDAAGAAAAPADGAASYSGVSYSLTPPPPPPPAPPQRQERPPASP